MNWKRFLGVGLVACSFLAPTAEAKEKLLFIPIDDRPVCLSYTVDSLKAAGWDIETPPLEYIASYNRTGDPDKLYQWLDEKALLATDAVVSSDSLIYGGLVPSRTHKLAPAVLAARTQRLLEFKKKYDCLRLYVFTTVMRSPRASSAPAEPAYYSQWGPKLFRLGELQDKKSQKIIKSKENKELQALAQEIPLDIQEDLYARRKANLAVTEKLLAGVQANSFDYFMLGRDDTAVYSDAHRDSDKLAVLTQKLPAWKIRFCAGADQLGLVLLNRAVNKIERRTPLVYTFYTEGKSGDSVPTYEDDLLKTTIKEHVLAAGAYPALLDKRADLILAVNTPVDGRYLSANEPDNTYAIKPAHERFLNKIGKYLSANYNVGIADVAYGNGSDNALCEGLFADKYQPHVQMPARAGIGPVILPQKLAWGLGSYAGWNTASNTLGYTLGQGLLRPYLTNQAKNDLMSVRYQDDWMYEANVRQVIRAQLIRPNHWVDGSLTDDQRRQAEAMLTENMQKFAHKYYTSKEAQGWKYTLPWSRGFEIKVNK